MNETIIVVLPHFNELYKRIHVKDHPNQSGLSG